MTIRLDFTITPSGRVSAGASGQVQNERRVYEILPGSVVRGALGAAWWSGTGPSYAGTDSQSAFDALFGQRMRVGFAAPQLHGHGPLMRPMSWVTCKYGTTDLCQGRWLDDAFDPAAHGPRCLCGEPYVRGRGWQLPTEVARDGRRQHLDWSARTTRTALHDNETARQGLLFTRRAMRQTVTYHGSIQIEAGEDQMPAEVQWLTSERRLSIGGQRSTLGRSTWHAQVVEVPPLPTPADRLMLARLMTPAILVDRYGAASTDLAAALAAVAGRSGGGVQVRRGWLRPASIGGWHGMAGLPKPIDLAVQAGSTALLTDWPQDRLDALSDGIGIRRLEGYGQVAVVSRTTETAALEHASTALPEPEPDRGVLWALLSDVAALDRGRRRAVLNAALGQAQAVATRVGHDGSADIRQAAVDEAMRVPTLQRVGPDTREEIRRLLSEADLDHLRTALANVVKGGAA